MTDNEQLREDLEMIEDCITRWDDEPETLAKGESAFERVKALVFSKPMEPLPGGRDAVKLDGIQPKHASTCEHQWRTELGYPLGRCRLCDKLDPYKADELDLKRPHGVLALAATEVLRTRDKPVECQRCIDTLEECLLAYHEALLPVAGKVFKAHRDDTHASHGDPPADDLHGPYVDVHELWPILQAAQQEASKAGGDAVLHIKRARVLCETAARTAQRRSE